MKTWFFDSATMPTITPHSPPSTISVPASAVKVTTAPRCSAARCPGGAYPRPVPCACWYSLPRAWPCSYPIVEPDEPDCRSCGLLLMSSRPPFLASRELRARGLGPAGAVLLPVAASEYCCDRSASYPVLTGKRTCRRPMPTPDVQNRKPSLRSGAG